MVNHQNSNEAQWDPWFPTWVLAITKGAIHDEFTIIYANSPSIQHSNPCHAAQFTPDFTITVSLLHAFPKGDLPSLAGKPGIEVLKLKGLCQRSGWRSTHRWLWWKWVDFCRWWMLKGGEMSMLLVKCCGRVDSFEVDINVIGWCRWCSPVFSHIRDKCHLYVGVYMRIIFLCRPSALVSSDLVNIKAQHSNGGLQYHDLRILRVVQLIQYK